MSIVFSFRTLYVIGPEEFIIRIREHSARGCDSQLFQLRRQMKKRPAVSEPTGNRKHHAVRTVQHAHFLFPEGPGSNKGLRIFPRRG